MDATLTTRLRQTQGKPVQVSAWAWSDATRHLQSPGGGL